MRLLVETKSGYTFDGTPSSITIRKDLIVIQYNGYKVSILKKDITNYAMEGVLPNVENQ